MRSVRVVAVCALVAAPLALAAPAKAELLVNVSKSQQRLAVVLDGKELYRWEVSTGRRGHTTPSGTYHPIRLERHWYSHEYHRSPMPWSVFFYRGYAVHGTMEADNLGHAASHGCVRLRPDHAAMLYSLVRREGMGRTKIVVMQGHLPVPRGAVPVADASPPRAAASEAATEAFAKALPDDDAGVAPAPAAPSQELQADTHHEDARRAEAHAGTLADAPVNAREAHAALRPGIRVATAQGSDAEVLRGRKAWLAALAHQYGFNRW